MKSNLSFLRVGVLCLLAGQRADAAITLDLTSPDSIKAAAKTAAKDLMTYYTGYRPGDTPGNLPDPYYWWECGAMFGTIMNYWYYTGDTTYNDMTTQALLHQAGDDGTFMPDNQTKTLGNDDQGFWGMAAMTAAEVGFPNPPSKSFQWLELVQGVFNTQAARWDMATCNGGLRWQIFTFNNGYTYKNAISNGCFFNMGARLALYTGNTTYADWAEKTWDWVTGTGTIGPDYKVYDGVRVGNNCTTHDTNQWTYNAGIYLLGAATMYNYTNGSAIWEERTRGMLNASLVFFADGIMNEACETAKCNVDQRSFKAYFARWLAATAELAPFTKSTILPLIASSATAAVKTCTAGNTGTQCGLKWGTGTNDGSLGVGEQMAVLEIVQSNLVELAPGWKSAVKGTGTSKGNPKAGTTADAQKLVGRPATAGDRVGAGILTALALVGVVAGSVTMIMENK